MRGFAFVFGWSLEIPAFPGVDEEGRCLARDWRRLRLESRVVLSFPLFLWLLFHYRTPPLDPLPKGLVLFRLSLENSHHPFVGPIFLSIREALVALFLQIIFVVIVILQAFEGEASVLHPVPATEEEHEASLEVETKVVGMLGSRRFWPSIPTKHDDFPIRE